MAREQLLRRYSELIEEIAETICMLTCPFDTLPVLSNDLVIYGELKDSGTS